MPANRLDLDDALQAILEDTRPIIATERLAVTDALGRIAASSVLAPMDLPPFPASAMDGYAVRCGDLKGDPPYRVAITGTSSAGHPLAAAIDQGCVRIFTGAVIPQGLDAVVIQEDCNRDGDAVIIRERVRDGDNVRPVGHDVRAGAQILAKGQRITPFDLGWLAACGVDRVDVYQRARIGIFSTGDELLDPGAAPGPGQIFDANRMTLRALLANLPVTVRDYGIAADRPEAIRRLLQRADWECDLVITSGGVSVGESDWVKQVVEEIGHLDLWRLNLKPGKPVAYGRLGRSAFFGLPGNPVSTIVTALLLVKPVIVRLCGGRSADPLVVTALLEGSLKHQPGREEFQRGSLEDRDGTLTVRVTGDQSSNRLASFTAANCLIRVGRDLGDLAEGSQVDTLPFGGML
ncbi:MAG: molybdopterin molybdotransferase MoeA [Pseudomonadales bacterium]